MMDKKKADPQASPLSAHTPASASLYDTSISPDALLWSAPTKIARVLVFFRHVGSLNRFEAARLVGDTVLNSTIPRLEQQGLTFLHTPEKSPNHWGAPCDVTRYRLLPASHKLADELLAQMFARGKGAA